jgi:hypothetical protein
VSHKYILVSFKAYDAAKITDLVSKVKAMDGVQRVGNLEYDNPSEVPPYCFVYVDPDADLEAIAAEIRKDSNVARAEEPPARYAA